MTISAIRFSLKKIADNKGYSISGDHRRVMEDEYIPKYKKYGKTELPLALFAG